MVVMVGCVVTVKESSNREDWQVLLPSLHCMTFEKNVRARCMECFVLLFDANLALVNKGLNGKLPDSAHGIVELLEFDCTRVVLVVVLL